MHRFYSNHEISQCYYMEYNTFKGVKGVKMLVGVVLSSFISMVSTPGIPKFGYLVLFGLSLLLLLKDVLSTSDLQGKAAGSSLNLVIWPLLIVFIATVVYKIVEIL